jgi:hypothetical protein
MVKPTVIISSSWLMLVGVLWALGIGYMFLVLSGIAELISTGYALVYFGALSIGPALLLVGPIFVLQGARPRLGAALASIGCIILTVLAGDEFSGLFHRDPLQAPPSYVFYFCLVAATLLTDLGAVLLFLSSSHPNHLTNR